MDYQQTQEYLLNIPRFTSKNEPEKTKAFLEQIGDFSKRIPTVHVAGTNGKGSVCAYLRAGLEANGLKVGLFTSPHLVSMRERFMIGEEMISEREFANVFNYVGTLLEDMHRMEGFSTYHPTFFEYLFFMACVWFKEKNVDVVVLETGLGGRLDATNSISSPKVCVITEIGLDHCEYLGNTKELIAAEKAGIIKPGVPVVHWSKNQPFDGVILDKARELGSSAVFVSEENIKNLETFSAGIDFSLKSSYDECVKFSLNTSALYQVENAAVSFETLMLLSNTLTTPLDISKCISGFSNMKWPGRMEKIYPDLYIDGGHNEDGIEAFLKSVSCDGCGTRCLLYSAVSDKNIEKVAGLIKESGLFEKIILCKLDSYRAADMERISSAFSGAGNIECYDTVNQGFSQLVKEAESGVRCYAVGSLYLVGEIKALLLRGNGND